MVVAAAGLTVVAAAHRDVGSGLIAGRTTRPGRFRLLRSVPGFAMRRTLPSTFGWAAGLGAYFMLIGLLARSLTDFLVANPRFAELAAQAGFAGLTSVQGYVAALFALLAIPLGSSPPAGSVSTPLMRCKDDWLLEFLRPLLTLSLVPCPSCRAGRIPRRARRDGSAWQPWPAPRLVNANLQLTEALAGRPERCARSRAVPRRCSARDGLDASGRLGGRGDARCRRLLVDVLTQTFGWPDWLGQLSPFAHLASVPATSPNWAGGSE